MFIQLCRYYFCELALRPENRWVRLTEKREFATHEAGDDRNKTRFELPSSPSWSPHRRTLLGTNRRGFTFVDDLALAVRLEVISAPQPAHLRHLGQLNSNVADVKEAFFFLSLSLSRCLLKFMPPPGRRSWIKFTALQCKQFLL